MGGLKIYLMLSILSAIVFAGGCNKGPKIVPVSGQVLIDGKPLCQGSVAFAPSNWRASGGTLDSEGRFRLEIQERNRIVDGTVLGVQRVIVSGAERISKTQTKWHAPPKYADFTTSGLTYDVTGPIDNATINITWAGGKPFIEIIEGAGSESARER